MLHPVRSVGIVASALIATSGCAFSTSSRPPAIPSTSPLAVAPIPPSVLPQGVIAFRRFADASLTTSQIVTAELDGNRQRMLTARVDGQQDTLPAWSPDGKYLAFMRITPGPRTTAEVDVVPHGGGEVRQVTHSPAGSTCDESTGPEPTAPATVSCNGDPAWSPDGRTLAYSHLYRRDSVTRSEIWLTDRHGRTSRALTTSGPARDSAPAWSPDGTRVAFQRVTDNGMAAVFAVRSDGTGRPQQLTPANSSFGDHPAWSPDSTQLVFRSNPDNPTQQFRPSDIYTVHADGTGLKKITPTGPNLEFLSSSWSPDGQWIVTALVERGVHNSQAQLYLFSPSTGRRRILVENHTWQSAPRWMPKSG